MEKDICGPSSHIIKIYSFNGQSRSHWKFLLFEIFLDKDDLNNQIYSKLSESVNESTNFDLTSDIMDFIVDYGKNKSIIDLISDEIFLTKFRNLLKKESNLTEENRKKLVYLVQKWGLKFEKDEKHSSFNESYNFLKRKKIVFPDNKYYVKTYDKYISNDEILKTIDIIHNINKKKKEYERSIKEFYEHVSTQYSDPFRENEKKKQESEPNQKIYYTPGNKDNNSKKEDTIFFLFSSSIEKDNNYPTPGQNKDNNTIYQLGSNILLNNQNSDKQQVNPKVNNEYKNDNDDDNMNFKKSAFFCDQEPFNKSHINNESRNNSRLNRSGIDINNNGNKNNINSNIINDSKIDDFLNVDYKKINLTCPKLNCNNIFKNNSNQQSLNIYNNIIINNNNNHFNVDSFKEQIWNYLFIANNLIDKAKSKEKYNNMDFWIDLHKKIEYLINEITKCEFLSDEYNRNYNIYNTLQLIKMDFTQTCYRYECLLTNQFIPDFKSAFFNNSNKYSFNKDFILNYYSNNNYNNFVANNQYPVNNQFKQSSPIIQSKMDNYNN